MQRADLSLFIKGESCLHSVHPLSKLTYVLLTGVTVYCAPGGYLPAAILLGVNLLLAAISGILLQVWKFSWRTLLPLALFMIPIHGFLNPDNHTLLTSYHGVGLYLEGLVFAGRVLLQLAAVLCISLIFVFTTHPADLITSLTQAGLSASFAYILGSPLLLLPAMRERAKTIQDAQRARGLGSDGGVIKRIRSMAPLISPLILGAFAEIEQRAIALELRGFNSARTKTSLRVVPDSATQRAVRKLMLLVCLLLFIYKIVPYQYVSY
ncbi:energy-coupling factor transporter transmembrane protein EcfT [Desulfovibrio sp. JC022]|uniref:energy-coupling factor transporter transmembrane component T family protein n=1 Tax=Desulfovibrio sp. JC022 TaxID=2593642 RepID=UPI0013D5E1B8|nr:energy-coupling factor transporter transmembrane component T [Desulfovibrio sp. JC022]NDV22314.1 energy-coupling factor transporter transmembrane protein EcfT [Desulfovibrio sp. JC022]